MCLSTESRLFHFPSHIELNTSISCIFDGSTYMGGWLPITGSVGEHIELLAKLIWALVDVHIMQVNVFPAGDYVTTRHSGHS